MRLDTVLEKLITASVDHGEAPSHLESEERQEPRAAVAAILREPAGASSAELFFIRRAEQPNDPWSGHVAFPGGRREPIDRTLLATAIRETREEVGIELEVSECVARLPDVHAFTRSKRGQLVVSVFVFVVKREVEVVPQSSEVATTIWVPLSDLAAAVGKETFELDHDGRKYEFPYVYLQPGEHRLWGMTYGMLISLLDAVK
ncbi:MAG: CoA pyrophosphatase [Labilithrix sp.]